MRSSAVVICQLISPAMKRSSSPNLVILSIPIGDQALEKHVEAKALWIKLIHMWPSSGSASWPMVHHPLKLCEPLKPLTMASISCFSRCTAVDTYLIRQQAELSLSRGGLGMRSLSHHSPASYIASLRSSGFSAPP